MNYEKMTIEELEAQNIEYGQQVEVITDERVKLMAVLSHKVVERDMREIIGKMGEAQRIGWKALLNEMLAMDEAARVQRTAVIRNNERVFPRLKNIQELSLQILEEV